MSELKVNKISPSSGTAFTLGDSGDTFTVPSGATLTVAGTLTQTGAQTFDGGVEIDNFTINGTEIDLSSGDMTLDSAGDIILDADGADLKFQDGGTDILSITNNSTDVDITVATQDKDINFKGDDGGSGITALSLDMSDAGTAVFNHDIRIADGGQIGSASDADAIAIAANGVVTFSQAPVLPIGGLDIDGATDIGAAIVDADLFVVDDGAGGTNRKTTASRLKTYIGTPGWVKLNTQTVSGTPTTIESGAVFSSTYDTYVIVIRRYNNVSGGGLHFQIGDSSAYVSSGYRWNVDGGGGTGSALNSGVAGSSVIDLLGGTSSTYHMNSTQDVIGGVIWVHNPYNSARTQIHAELAWENATDVDAHIANVGGHPNTGASYDRWKMICPSSSQTFEATTIIDTYGVNHA